MYGRYTGDIREIMTCVSDLMLRMRGATFVRPAVSGGDCAAAGFDSSGVAGVASSLSPPPSKVSGGGGLPLLPLANGPLPVPMPSPAGATASAIDCAAGLVLQRATLLLRRRRVACAELWRGEAADSGVSGVSGVSEPAADGRLGW